MSSGSIRIIQLPEKSSVNTDDYMAVDSSANGTKKVKFTDLLDDNLSAQNKAADAQATGEAINDVSTRTSEAINNVSARVDNMINTQQNASVTTLWTGTLKNKNQSVTLSKSIANFDFVDVYCGGVESTFVRKPVANSITFHLQQQNMSDDASVQGLRWWESGLTISGTTATITKCVQCYWDDFSQVPVVSQSTDGIEVIRIDGVKIGHVEDDEVVDARVGADGTTYPTLGDAIRGQVTDLKSAINVLSIPLVEGYYINTSGGQGGPSSAFSITDYCPFTSQDKFTLEGFKNADFQSYALGYAFYDDDKTFISGSGNFNGNLLSDNVSIPNNTAFVRFSTRTEYAPNAKVYIYNSNGITTLSKAIQIIGNNLFDSNKIVVGKEIYSDGSIRPQSNSAITDYIDISNNNGFIVLSGLPQYDTSMQVKFYSFFNSSKTLLSYGSLSNDFTEAQLAVPDNAKYFVISVYQRATTPSSVDYSDFMIAYRYTTYSDYIKYFGGVENYPIEVLNKMPQFSTMDKTLLIFGDSITETATVSDDGLTYRENTRQNWPTYAKKILQVKQMINFAKSGATYKDVSGAENRQKISFQISSAISSGRTGDIIVISAGTNDGGSSIGSYETAMSKTTLDSLDRTVLYEAIRWAMWTIRTTYKDAICFVATPIQRADREPIQAVKDAIVQMAHRYNFIVIDAETQSGIVRENQVWESSGNDLYDGLHPNTNGQKKMAKLYASVILRNIPQAQI